MLVKYNKRPVIINLSNKVQRRILFGTAALLSAHALSPHGASAAGFMDNSLANFAKIKSLPEGIKDMVKTVAAVSYLIPPLVIIGCIVGCVMAAQHSEGAASKAKIASVIIIIGLAVLSIYDSFFVGSV